MCHHCITLAEVLIPANLLPPQIMPLLPVSVNSWYTCGKLVGISVWKSNRWLVECESVSGACACLRSQTWEHECLISLERVLTYCWVGIGWGLSILSNNEKSERSGICCWPDWHNLLLSELFLLMENLNQKSCCPAWHEPTHLSSFSPRKPANPNWLSGLNSYEQPLWTGVLERLGETS